MKVVLKNLFHQSRRHFAKLWLSLMPAIQIGITGSFGKTSTTRAITEVLRTCFRVVQTDLNLDTIYNVPITACRVTPFTQVAVFELGVDKVGEMTKHLEIVKPKIGVVTGITPVHSDSEHLGSLANIIKEKQKLVEALPKDGLAVLNWDDEKVRQMANKTQARVAFYGKDKKNCQIWAEKIETSLAGLSFLLNLEGRIYQIKTKLLGEHHVYTCMAAAAVGKELGLSASLILKGLAELVNLSGRLDIKEGPLKTTLLDDHLRANPASTRAGLLFLSELKTKGRKIAVLGEMGELGRYAVEEHQKIGKLAAQLDLDFLICVGPFQKETYQAAFDFLKRSSVNSKNHKQLIWAADVFEAANKLKEILKKDDMIYLKGSLLRHMERILLLLEGKKVRCRLVSCHYYHQCQLCPMLYLFPTPGVRKKEGGERR